MNRFSSFASYVRAVVVGFAFATLGLPTLASTACPGSYAGGAAPEIFNKSMAPRTRELCFSAFAVMHSGITRTPLWSASHLTRDSVNAARELLRRNTFHTESQLPSDERAELKDYSRSGRDRGHLFPAGDAPTQEAQHESFTLANMIPQDPDNNRHLWEGIESAVRTLARNDGDVYVISGPLFQGANLVQLNGRVLVPTQIYKVVYSPHQHGAAAYIVNNAPGHQYEVISVADIERIAGINFFPTMSAAMKAHAIRLPGPNEYGSHSHSNADTE